MRKLIIMSILFIFGLFCFVLMIYYSRLGQSRYRSVKPNWDDSRWILSETLSPAVELQWFQTYTKRAAKEADQLNRPTQLQHSSGQHDKKCTKVQ